MRAWLPVELDAVGVELLHRYLGGHSLLLGDLFRAESRPSNRNRLLRHGRMLGVQRDLVLLLGNGRTVRGSSDVRVGGWFALGPNLLVFHGDGLGDALGGDVFAQARASGFDVPEGDSGADAMPDALMRLASAEESGSLTAGAVLDVTDVPSEREPLERAALPHAATAVTQKARMSTIATYRTVRDPKVDVTDTPPVHAPSKAHSITA